MKHFLLREIAIRAGIAALCFLYFASCASTQTNERQAQELAKAEIQKVLSRDVHKFLQIKRDAALENDFPPCTTYASRPLLFRATDEGQETREGVTIEHLSVHGPLQLVVAVATTGRAFLIKGASDSKRQFEDLAREVKCRLSNSDVRDYVKFYWEVNPENFSATPITSSQQFREEATRRFRSAFGDVNGDDEFGRWWSRYGSNASQHDFSMQVSRNSRGFVASFYVLSDLGSMDRQETPRILKATMVVSTRGQISTLALEPVGTTKTPPEQQPMHR